jgi:hypothetical protein
MNGNGEKPAIEMNMETCNWPKGTKPIHSKLRITSLCCLLRLTNDPYAVLLTGNPSDIKENISPDYNGSCLCHSASPLLFYISHSVDQNRLILSDCQFPFIVFD